MEKYMKRVEQHKRDDEKCVYWQAVVVCVSEYLYREIIWNLKEIPRQITHPIFSIFFRFTHTHTFSISFLPFFIFVFSFVIFIFGAGPFFRLFFFYSSFLLYKWFFLSSISFFHIFIYFFFCFSSFPLAWMRRIFEIICI